MIFKEIKKRVVTVKGLLLTLLLLGSPLQGMEEEDSSQEQLNACQALPCLLPHHPALTDANIKALVKRGQAVLFAISKGTYAVSDNWSILGDSVPNFKKYYSPPTNTQGEHLAYTEDMIALTWALDHAAKGKNNTMSRGSFSIIDPDSHLMNFFDGFVRLFYPNTPLDMIPYWRAYNLAYNRTGRSSHYLGDLTQRQWGLDMRFHQSLYAFPILPYQMTHLLVGRVKTRTGLDKTFVKWEPYGLGDKYSYVGHFYEYYTTPSEPPEKMKRERDILPEIASAALEFQGKMKTVENKDPTIWNPFISLATIKVGNTFDISLLWKLALDAKETGEPMRQILLKYYPEDTLPWRTGNEVIFSLDELTRLAIISNSD